MLSVLPVKTIKVIDHAESKKLYQLLVDPYLSFPSMKETDDGTPP